MNNKEMGRKLRELRMRKGLTMTELGRRVGMSQAQISRIETGKQGFRSATLVKMAQALGVDPVYFFVEEEGTGPKGKRGGAPAAHRHRSGAGAPRADAVSASALDIALRDPSFRGMIERAAEFFATDAEAFSSFTESLEVLLKTRRRWPAGHRRGRGRGRS